MLSFVHRLTLSVVDYLGFLFICIGDRFMGTQDVNVTLGSVEVRAGSELVSANPDMVWSIPLYNCGLFFPYQVCTSAWHILSRVFYHLGVLSSPTELEVH